MLHVHLHSLNGDITDKHSENETQIGRAGDEIGRIAVLTTRVGVHGETVKVGMLINMLQYDSERTAQSQSTILTGA